MIKQKVHTAKFLVSISKLVAPPLDKVVRHGGVRGGCRSSQRFVARHALRSRTHPKHFKRAAVCHYKIGFHRHCNHTQSNTTKFFASRLIHSWPTCPREQQQGEDERRPSHTRVVEWLTDGLSREGEGARSSGAVRAVRAPTRHSEGRIPAN